jgi:hypothetical protein
VPAQVIADDDVMPLWGAAPRDKGARSRGAVESHSDAAEHIL